MEFALLVSVLLWSGISLLYPITLLWNDNVYFILSYVRSMHFASVFYLQEVIIKGLLGVSDFSLLNYVETVTHYGDF